MKSEAPAPGDDRVPVTAEHRRNIVDPLTAWLIPVRRAAMRLARGLRAHAADLRRPATLRSQARVQAHGQGRRPTRATRGRSSSARVTFQPVAGHRASSTLVRFLSQGREIELWLAPVTGTRLWPRSGFPSPACWATWSCRRTNFSRSLRPPRGRSDRLRLRRCGLTQWSTVAARRGRSANHALLGEGFSYDLFTSVGAPVYMMFTQVSLQMVRPGGPAAQQSPATRKIGWGRRVTATWEDCEQAFIASATIASPGSLGHRLAVLRSDRVAPERTASSGPLARGLRARIGLRHRAEFPLSARGGRTARPRLRRGSVRRHAAPGARTVRAPAMDECQAHPVRCRRLCARPNRSTACCSGSPTTPCRII